MYRLLLFKQVYIRTKSVTNDVVTSSDTEAIWYNLSIHNCESICKYLVMQTINSLYNFDFSSRIDRSTKPMHRNALVWETWENRRLRERESARRGSIEILNETYFIDRDIGNIYLNFWRRNMKMISKKYL